MCIDDNDGVYSDDFLFEETQILVPDTQKLASCCFTGHRKLPKDGKRMLLAPLKSAVSYLVSAKGVNTFRAGGALGFDTFAATVIIDMKRENPKLRLALDLPFETQAQSWSDNDKRIYEFIKQNADEINYYFDGVPPKSKYSECMFKRNRALVDNSAYCICYLASNRGGTAYTVDYATRRGCEIFNLYNKNGADERQ